ncbi:HupE/UreJ family protein [Xylanimonas ulmi]|uniref:HupE/UreJ protein n=1 Tax=Xylanimonas ulmi TaxID=228973 RepID=A0A4Q7M092_9MICO|nr:HupE/UreJ family protein [Xylanibacterium ulmi]RZS61156.1 HupE/UreJ protein [Xylanibacterium ulmi]
MRRHLLTAALAAVAAIPLFAAPAAAHGFSSTVYADVTTPSDGTVRTQLGLEYDLLVVSVAEHAQDPALFDDGMAVWQTGEEPTALADHAASVLRYVEARYRVSVDGERCVASQVGAFGVTERDGVPYALLTLDHTCAPSDGDGPRHTEITSTLFGDDEGYVTGTTTILDYDLAGAAGSAALTGQHPTFESGQPWYDRMGEFFVLGAEHLLTGIDHILFLLALIVGSRRLRDVVLAATSFTLAHSVTFLLAALGLVDAPAALVEPVIAASIAIVALWHLWALRRRGDALGRGAVHRPTSASLAARLELDRADWLRLAVVFAFGLIHGLGFAGALGIDEAFSWTLLWSLLVFNVGIEVVQLSIIAVVFPLLTLLRRRAPRTGRWVGAVVAAGVAVMGVIWFVQRIGVG